MLDPEHLVKQRKDRGDDAIDKGAGLQVIVSKRPHVDLIKTKWE